MIMANNMLEPKMSSKSNPKQVKVWIRWCGNSEEPVCQNLQQAFLTTSIVSRKTQVVYK